MTKKEEEKEEREETATATPQQSPQPDSMNIETDRWMKRETNK